LTSNLQSFWADSGAQYSVPSQLNGSTVFERWYLILNSGTIQGSIGLNFAYYHQFLLNVTGAQVYSQWYNSSDMAQVFVPGVHGRTSGMGQRVNSYSVDGGASNPLQPTTGTIAISFVMNTTHQLQINSVRQYQVTLDNSAARALALITAPTISGDNYWYDEGTQVELFLNGVGSRLAGSGEKLASYSVNGVLTSVSTANQVDVLNIGSLLSPQTVSAAFTVQYQLSTPQAP
jgi:hypothetical protein